MLTRISRLYTSSSLVLFALLVLAAISACDTDQEEANATNANAISPTTDAVLQSIKKAQGELRSIYPSPAEDDPVRYDVSPDTREQILREGKLVDLKHALLERIGECSLACKGSVTPLGMELLTTLESLEDHMLEPRAYDMPFLREQIDTWHKETGADALWDPQDSATIAASKLLLAPRISDEAAAASLESVSKDLSAEKVQKLVGIIQKVHKSEAAEKTREFERKLLQAYVRYGLDMGFVRRVGPFRITTKKEERFVDKYEEKILARLQAIATAPTPKEGLDSLVPQSRRYKELQKTYKHYRKLDEDDACAQLPSAWRFEKGTKGGPEVSKLQKRLACEGHFEGTFGEHYNERTKAAVRQYQEHHFMKPTGFVDEGTLKSLNVTMERRAEIIGTNMRRVLEREREIASKRGEFYIRVNLPSYTMEVYERDRVVRTERVIVGSNKLDDNKVTLTQGHINRTKVFDTRMYNIVVNPDWILPERMQKGELQAYIEKYPNYLKENNIYKTKLGSGKEVYVQGVGKGNVLGKVKFLLEESNAIYLHDTNDPWLFRKKRRDFSHGCVRVENAADFSKWLLDKEGYHKHEVKKAFRAKKKQRSFKLKKPIPVFTTYQTVEINSKGQPIFYDDLYGYDQAYFTNNVPPRETTWWGNSKLRPRWVPTMPKDTINEWKRKGKAAPRNLKPKGFTSKKARDSKKKKNKKKKNKKK